MPKTLGAPQGDGTSSVSPRVPMRPQSRKGAGIGFVAGCSISRVIGAPTGTDTSKPVLPFAVKTPAPPPLAGRGTRDILVDPHVDAGRETEPPENPRGDPHPLLVRRTRSRDVSSEPAAGREPAAKSAGGARLRGVGAQVFEEGRQIT